MKRHMFEFAGKFILLNYKLFDIEYKILKKLCNVNFMKQSINANTSTNILSANSQVRVVKATVNILRKAKPVIK